MSDGKGAAGPRAISAMKSRSVAVSLSAFSQRRNASLVLVAIATGVLSALVVRQKSPIEKAVPEQDGAPALAASTRPPSEETETALRFYLERVRRACA